jgi:predicted DNA-binding transcriptional regulator YafY
MQRLKKDQSFFLALRDIGTAWHDGRCVKIRYRSLNEPPKERIIEPYFIQPGALERGTYVIAKCRLTGSIRTFKIERIESIELLNERYAVPDDFDANEYLGSSWGITTDSKARTIKLKFSPDLATIAEETSWHPTQITQLQLDESAIVTMKLHITSELYAFILGWGEKVEVLEPRELRDRIAKMAEATVEVYKGKG